MKFPIKDFFSKRDQSVNVTNKIANYLLIAHYSTASSKILKVLKEGKNAVMYFLHFIFGWYLRIHYSNESFLLF